MVIPNFHDEGYLQDWLTSIEIKYYESKVNLNWKNIIKMIKEVSLTFRFALCNSLKLAICVSIIHNLLWFRTLKDLSKMEAGTFWMPTKATQKKKTVKKNPNLNQGKVFLLVSLL
jgi:hypothetical protein